MSLLEPSIEDLPVPVMVDILSRLPVKTIIHCKCVCKTWLNIVLDSYFANIQLSRSHAGLMIHHNPKEEFDPGILRWTEVEDEPNQYRLHHDPVMSLDLNLTPISQYYEIYPVGSVDGLVCLWQHGDSYVEDNTYICNPITREYIIIPRKQPNRKYKADIIYCFGVSSLTQEYKVIQIFQRNMNLKTTSKRQPRLSEAEVYTLGTGQPRSLGHVHYRLKQLDGPFLNGHAHWIVMDQDSPEKICAFDFDNETFELFPSPPSDERQTRESLGVLKGCLCQCDSDISKLSVWVMKEYGIKESWHKELMFEERIGPGLELGAVDIVYVLEGFKDGPIWMASYRNKLYVYCPQRKMIVDKEIFSGKMRGFAYRPSFHRLQNFKHERVCVFQRSTHVLE